MIKGLVSIITPVYNGERFIAETIDSVLCQTYPHWEMIIIDDGSNDRTSFIVEEYTSKDSRIKLLRQANAGSASARNKGIRFAEGQYIALLDADDIWEPNFIKSQIEFMEQKKAILVYSSYHRINEKSQIFMRPCKARPMVNFRQMQRLDYIGCLTGLYDTSVYGKIYLHEELRSLRDDYAYWLDIIKLTEVAYGNPEILARYRVMSSSTSGKKWKLIKKQYLFYYKYQRLGWLKSILYTIYWGITGILKYSR